MEVAPLRVYKRNVDGLKAIHPSSNYYKLLIWRGKRATSLLLYHDSKTHTRKDSRLSSQGMANLGLNGPYYLPLVRNGVLPIKADMH